MTDPYAGHSDISSSGDSWAAITPSDTAALAVVPKALWVDAGGNIAMRGADGVAATFAVQASQLLPLRPTVILITGTTATGIKAIF